MHTASTSHPQREDQWQAKSKLACGWLRMADVGLRPFLLHRQETEERSVSRQTWGTSCFCTRGRTISESHCRSVIGVMLSNQQRKHPDSTNSRLVSGTVSCTSVCVCVSECLVFVSLTWHVSVSVSFTQTIGQICRTSPLQRRWQCVQCDWKDNIWDSSPASAKCQWCQTV